MEPKSIIAIAREWNIHRARCTDAQSGSEEAWLLAFGRKRAQLSKKRAVTVIQKVREENPDQYLKIVASILPKEIMVDNQSLDDISDDELLELLAALRSVKSSVQTPH